MIYVSRHAPTNAMYLLVSKHFNERLERVSITWDYHNPEKQLMSLGLMSRSTVAGVIPPPIVCKLLNHGYKLLLFVNDPRERAVNRYKCLGAHLLELMPHKINIKWYRTVVEIEDQPTNR